MSGVGLRTVLGAALCGVLIALSPSPAWAALDPSELPPAVVAALEPGSAVFDTIRDLNASDSAGNVDTAARPAAASTRFGTPHAYYYFALAPSDSPTLAKSDTDQSRGRTWLAVELRGNHPARHRGG